MQLAVENTTCNSATKWHDSVPASAKICTKRHQVWWSFVKLLMTVSFYTDTDSHNVGICIQMGNVHWVLKWYCSLTKTLFKFVGSKPIPSLRLPGLSLPSTRTKLVIHGVACCTGLSTPACNILLTSGWTASFRWTGIGWQAVCFSGTTGPSCMWYGGHGNLPIPSKTSVWEVLVWELFSSKEVLCYLLFSCKQLLGILFSMDDPMWLWLLALGGR